MTFQRLPQVPPMELPKELKEIFELRIAQGMKPDPKMVISNWVKRGLVSRDESCGVYVKVVSSQ